MIIVAIPKLIGVESMAAQAESAGIGHMFLPTAIIELICAAFFLIPSTRRIGFFLCVAYIGGIMATNWFEKSFNMGIVLQILLWIGMYFEDKDLFRIGNLAISSRKNDIRM